jgi:hypothetical protein
MSQLPKLKKGDWVKMYFPFCDMELFVQFLTYENHLPDTATNHGFIYFHPKTGETAAWYLSHILEVRRKKKCIFIKER